VRRKAFNVTVIREDDMQFAASEPLQTVKVRQQCLSQRFHGGWQGFLEVATDSEVLGPGL
jgi:hypothetical protein